MQSKVSFALLALALVAVPLSAQGRSSKVPPGQLPPRGMCRVWIDGVPPGQQPPVTTCAVAAANRVANSRVIYGDRESFPGKGNARFNTSNGDVGRACSAWDAVVVDGRLVNVCRDDRVVTDRRGRTRNERLLRGQQLAFIRRLMEDCRLIADVVEDGRRDEAAGVAVDAGRIDEEIARDILRDFLCRVCHGTHFLKPFLAASVFYRWAVDPECNRLELWDPH